MFDRISFILSDIKFGGRSTSFIQEEASELLRTHIERLWEKNELPLSEGKNWIVGFNVRHGFYSTSISIIKVGPKKPSRFRTHYSKIKVIPAS